MSEASTASLKSCSVTSCIEILLLLSCTRKNARWDPIFPRPRLAPGPAVVALTGVFSCVPPIVAPVLRVILEFLLLFRRQAVERDLCGRQGDSYRGDDRRRDQREDQLQGVRSLVCHL